jgi:hypothetical protein
MKIKDIVVVGGGSAGWMTAAILIKSFPDKNIAVIESSEIPRIGVGESTYDGINLYLEYLEIDREDFFAYTDATIKLGVQFRNFYKESGSEDFLYPFGKPNLKGTMFNLQDWQFKKVFKPETPIQEYAEFHFPSALLMKHNRLSDDKDKFEDFDHIYYSALHFDAIKFADWLKNNYSIPRGVKNIIGTVENISKNEEGIKSLTLKDGRVFHADLYIDCTGFKSLLLEKTLDEEFVSYRDVLPNNYAWAAQVDYIDRSVELENVTRCTALKNGWCWNTPLWSRIGSGYVYSNKYISHEEALEEFKDYLKNGLALPRSEEQVDSLKFNNIEMKSGIHKRVWVKNVVAIGLSAGFIEPLEGNGLFSVHEFLFELIKALYREEITQWDRDVFNQSVQNIFDQFVDFIRLHYSLSIRKDSEYWIENSQRHYDFESMSKRGGLPNHLLYTQEAKNVTLIPPTVGGITWICAGMNYPFIDTFSVKRKDIYNKEGYREKLEDCLTYLEDRKNIWEHHALQSETSEQYLQRKYYNKD